MALGQIITAGAASFRFLDLGRYIDAASTSDQPTYLDIDSTIKPDGVSSFLLKYRRYQNSAVPGAPDDLLQVHRVYKGSTKAFSQANFEAADAILTAFATTANLTMVFRGER